MLKPVLAITIIIPTYNRVSVLERAIESVLNQQYDTSVLSIKELIVVDDGSNDETQSLLTNIAKRDARLSVLKQDNSGVSAARNLGIVHASSDWLAFLDSDDEWLPTKLAAQVAKIKHTPSLVCHTQEIWVRNGKRVNQMNKHQKQGGDIFDKSLQMCAMSPSSILIHRDIFNQLGLFDETFTVCEDYDLWLRIAATTHVAYVEQPQIIKYGGHDDQLSRRYFAMDQYRISAIEKLFDDTRVQLTKSQRSLAQTTLNAKLDILTKGAEKHNNKQILAFCDGVRQRAQRR